MAGKPKLTPKQIELANTVIKRVSEGESLRAICRDMKIGHETFRQIRNKDEEIQARYARAKDDRADVLFEEILEIVDDSEADPQDRRLRMDARKWMAGKMRPKKYGDKLDLDIKAEVKHDYESAAETLANALAAKTSRQ